MSPSAQTLYTQLAKAIGVPQIPADANGIVQLTVGEGGTVMLIPEDAYSLMLMSPVGPLPGSMNGGTRSAPRFAVTLIACRFVVAGWCTWLTKSPIASNPAYIYLHLRLMPCVPWPCGCPPHWSTITSARAAS